MANQHSIKVGDEIKGCFIIFERDTIDNYSNWFTFIITNKALQIKKEIIFSMPQEAVLFESYCNGEDIVLMFSNESTNTLEYHTYNINGEKKFTYKKELNRSDFKPYKNLAFKGLDENLPKSIFAVDNIGFISKALHNEKKINSFKIDFYGTKENKEWSYEVEIKSTFFFGEYLGIHQNIVYLNLFIFHGSTYTEKPDIYIIGLDLKTGKEIFRKQSLSKNLLLPRGVTILKDGNGYLFGSYFDAKANMQKDKPNGFAIWKMNEKGEIFDDKYLDFESNFSKSIDSNFKGKVKELGNINFKNVVQLSDGNLYIVAEGFANQMNSINPLNIAVFGLFVTFMTTGTHQIPTDLFLIKLDSNYNSKELQVYEKKKNLFFYNAQMQPTKIQASFSLFYFSEKNKILNNINVLQDSVKVSKMEIKLKATKSYFLQATNQSILLLQYFEKEKKLKLNYELLK